MSSTVQLSAREVQGENGVYVGLKDDQPVKSSKEDLEVLESEMGEQIHTASCGSGRLTH